MILLTNETMKLLLLTTACISHLDAFTPNVDTNSYRYARPHPSIQTGGHFQHGRKSTELYGWFKKLTNRSKGPQVDKTRRIHVNDLIGSGSYGTVYTAQFQDDEEGESLLVAKRAWTIRELRAKDKEARKLKTGKTRQKTGTEETQKTEEFRRTGEFRKTGEYTAGTHCDTDLMGGTHLETKGKRGSMREKAKRCKHYLNIEQHCLEKMNSVSNNGADVKVPTLLGRFKDDKKGREWLVFDKISAIDELQIAPSLRSAMDEHRKGKDQESPHHLYTIQKELGMSESATLEDALDATLLGMLHTVLDCHNQNIVHRDVKVSSCFESIIAQENFEKIHAY